MFKSLAYSVLSVILFSGCFKDPPGPDCNYDVCANAAPAGEVQALETYITTNAITATKHCSGLYYRIETPGTGKTAGVCNAITIQYKGQTTAGNVFDQTTTGPRTFNLAGLILGWQNAVPLIKEGGKIIFYLPPSLAYGSQEQRDQNGNVIIPANSILIFEITLVAVS